MQFPPSGRKSDPCFYPIAFVPEHCETIVELGMDVWKLVMEKGVPAYIKVNTVSVGEKYI
jgi:protoheme ferro-lyase